MPGEPLPRTSKPRRQSAPPRQVSRFDRKSILPGDRLVQPFNLRLKFKTCRGSKCICLEAFLVCFPQLCQGVSFLRRSYAQSGTRPDFNYIKLRFTKMSLNFCVEHYSTTTGNRLVVVTGMRRASSVEAREAVCLPCC